MGISGEIAHARLVEALERVAAACAAYGTVFGIGGVYDQENATRYIHMGARFVLSGADHMYLLAGARARSEVLRNAV
jgi:2-keto-3-deoxy-L-rhamnonate aldolase RhmA